MKYAPFLFVLILVAGCKIKLDQTVAKAPAPANPSSTAGAEKTPNPSAPDSSKTTTGSVPASTTGSASKPSMASPSDIAPKLTDLEKEPGYNKDRIYQLSQLQKATLTINGQKLEAWIADTESKRAEGLMFVKDGDINPNQGMLFVYTTPSKQGFWMKHTYIPLDIAYIGADKTVVSTATMKPFDETNIPSQGMAEFALEMKKGTLQRLGIQKGTKIDIPPGIKAEDLQPPPQQPGMFRG